MQLSGTTIALVVTGSVAAYKSVQIARLLRKQGARVVPVLSHSATRFVGPVSFSAITAEPVAGSMWDAEFAGEKHVALADRADMILVAPATADFMARMVQGRADDLAAALVLSARGPVLVAPAMHPRMWTHPATQRNLAQLRADGVRVLGPVYGEVASGDTGMGRMLEPEQIVAALVDGAAAQHPENALVDGVAAQHPDPALVDDTGMTAQDLADLRLLISAGPTYEDLDPVRFLGNRSSGKMGFAIAARARARGAEVTLVAGPVELGTPAGVRRENIRSARELRDAMLAGLPSADAVVMTAAVADYRPRERAAHKIKKGNEPLTLELVQNPDILAELGRTRGVDGPVLVGFALETGDDEAVIGYARGKLTAKGVDMVVANHADDSLGRDENRVHLVTADAVRSLPVLDKTAVADALLDALLPLWQARRAR